MANFMDPEAYRVITETHQVRCVKDPECETDTDCNMDCIEAWEAARDAHIDSLIDKRLGK